MKFASLLLIPALTLAALACNGDEDEPSATATTPATVAAPTEAPASPAPGSPTAAPTQPAAVSPTPASPGSNAPFSFPADPDPPTDTLILDDVRVGEHPEGDFDRIVFEFEDGRPEGMIEYVDEAVQCGSGEPVDDLEGDAILKLRLDTTQAHNEQGQTTIDEQQIDAQGDAIAEARQICDFEGVVEWVVGVNGGEQPFLVSLLEDPSRVAIDIEWP